MTSDCEKKQECAKGLEIKNVFKANGLSIAL